MRILHVINSLSTGGAEKLLTELIPLQLNDGNEVDVVLFASGEFEFVSRLSATGVHVWFLGRNEKDIYNPLMIFKLMRYINQYDIVHVHLFPAQYWVAIAAWLMRSKTCMVTTEHSTNNRRRGKWYWKVVDRFIYNRYKCIVAISEKTKSALIEHVGLLRQSEVIVIPTGVDLRKIQDAKPYARNGLVTNADQSVLIAMVGRFAEAKDQDTIIQAMEYLPESYIVLFLGDGPRRTICEQKAKRMGVYDRTRFLGMRSDVPEILKTIDIAVHSSHWEGFNLSIIEEMAAGKPVVASDVPGSTEIVQGAGILFPEGDAQTLAKEVKKLAETPIHYNEVKNRCIERAKSYDIRIMKDQYDLAYRNLLGENNCQER